MCSARALPVVFFEVLPNSAMVDGRAALLATLGLNIAHLRAFSMPFTTAGMGRRAQNLQLCNEADYNVMINVKVRELSQ